MNEFQERLKELLEPIDDDLIVRVSVNYNNCDHIQDLKHIDFFNNTGTYKRFQLLDDLDDETKEKIDNIKTQQVNEVRQQLHDWNEKTYGNNQEIFDVGGVV